MKKLISHSTVRVFLLSVFFAVCGCAAAQPDPTLAKELPPVLNAQAENGAWVSTRIVDLSSGNEVFSITPDRQMTPASNMKLVITAATLQTFGDQYEFPTTLVQIGNNLAIIGSGDPGFGDPGIARKQGKQADTVLHEWADIVADAGITELANIYYDDSAFEQLYTHPNWDPPDLLYWYACPVSGLNFNDNCVDITIEPGEPGQPVTWTSMPETSLITVINECVSVGPDGKHAPQITKLPERNIYKLTGTASKKATLASKPVENPGAFAADAFRQALKKKGIKITGQVRPYHAAEKMLFQNKDKQARSKPAVLAVHKTAMKDILWRINKNSQNLFAECMAKAVGAKHSGQPGSWKNADKGIRQSLSKLGIDHRNIVIDDGSGLSDYNKVTTRIISDILLAMTKQPYAETFKNSLAVGGVDGTIRKRFKDHPNKVHAKTGYIHGVRSLSGYVDRDGNKPVIFSIIYNGIPNSVKPFEKLQDETCTILMDWEAKEK